MCVRACLCECVLELSCLCLHVAFSVFYFLYLDTLIYILNIMTKNIVITYPLLDCVSLYLSSRCYSPQMITLGGDAELELVDSLDPFSEGVVFSVRPPKKSWKNIANLSGGEKVV